MKALFIPMDDRKEAYDIELVPETEEEKEFLKKIWKHSQGARTISCEQWRELAMIPE